jgi:metallo-beta-lactamase family protein
MRRLPQLDDVVNPMDDGGSRKRPGPRRLSNRTIEDTDWHNDRAQFVFDVQDSLRKADDDKKRRTLLRRLRRALKR